MRKVALSLRPILLAFFFLFFFFSFLAATEIETILMIFWPLLSLLSESAGSLVENEQLISLAEASFKKPSRKAT